MPQQVVQGIKSNTRTIFFHISRPAIYVAKPVRGTFEVGSIRPSGLFIGLQAFGLPLDPIDGEKRVSMKGSRRKGKIFKGVTSTVCQIGGVVSDGQYFKHNILCYLHTHMRNKRAFCIGKFRFHIYMPTCNT